MIFKKMVSALAVTTALVTAGSAFAADKDHDWSKINILMLHWSQASNPFFEAVNNGGKDAAAQQGITLDIQYGEEDPVNETTILETAIANKVDAIVVGIADDNAYDDVLCRAADAGIVVLTINIDDSKGAEGGICRKAFMGQDFVETGYILGKRMIAEAGIKEGDVVFTPVEAPEGTYAVLRHEGVQKALSEVGATSEILGTGNDHGQALNLMTQYLLGHPEVKAIISLGQTPNSQAVQAAKDANMKVAIGGFDISESILKDIENGEMIAAVDQQPYSQGFFGVTQAALAVKYGLYPSEMNTGGAGLVDKTNYKSAVEWAGVVR